MKGTIELALVAILFLLSYNSSAVMTEFANSILGKLILIACVITIARTRGLVAGVLCALVMITIMHSSQEGMKNKGIPKGPTCAVINQKGKPTQCEKDTECGVSVSFCHPDEKVCHAVTNPEFETSPEGKATNDVSTFDVRLHEGMNNMNARANTISAMKFQNGYTGNREQFQGLI